MRTLLTIALLLGSALQLDAGGSEAMPLGSWDTMINTPDRFVIVMDGSGVLDKETGLVWERSPDLDKFHADWWRAIEHCLVRQHRVRVGASARRGWRLPTAEEVMTLFDSSQSGPTSIALPPGHPFSITLGAPWVWTTSTSTRASMSTSNPEAPRAYIVRLQDFSLLQGHKYLLDEPILTPGAWCVRGGHGHDAQQH